MADNNMSMPAGFGGLMRYNEEYNSKLKFGPGAVVGMIIATIVIVMGLRIFYAQMLGGVNPAQMKGMMKKMGISQEELPVRRVVFEMENGNLVVENPNVMRIKMQGQESFQVTGDTVEESAESFSDEDVEMVISQTRKSEEIVREALDKAGGDIAEAIVGLK